jgi:hypothetical protein
MLDQRYEQFKAEPSLWVTTFKRNSKRQPGQLAHRYERWIQISATECAPQTNS